jgi:hypothetical protein
MGLILCIVGVELSKDKPTYTWTFEEEDEDNDYLVHTLFLKNAVLGASAVKGERNLVQIETKNFDKTDISQPLLSLTLGQSDMVGNSSAHHTMFKFLPLCLIFSSSECCKEYKDLVLSASTELNI